MQRILSMMGVLLALAVLTAWGIAHTPLIAAVHAADPPDCTNGDCPPPPPDCTNGDCPPPPPDCTNGDCPPPPPDCTNGDCPPPPPDCTNGDCPPADTPGCCCFQDYEPDVPGVQRLCCCKKENRVSCRLSTVISLYEHITIADVQLRMGRDTLRKCKGHWSPPAAAMPWWTKGEACGWMTQLHKCGPVAGSR